MNVNAYMHTQMDGQKQSAKGIKIISTFTRTTHIFHRYLYFVTSSAYHWRCF